MIASPSQAGGMAGWMGAVLPLVLLALAPALAWGQAGRDGGLKNMAVNTSADWSTSRAARDAKPWRVCTSDWCGADGRGLNT
jgi:hypothetical protein